MHLLEAYAITSGSCIDKCFIYEESISLPDKPYITLHSYNPKGSGRQYKYWNDVIDKLNNYSNFNYEIIQIGGVTDTPTKANTSYLGKTNYNSLAYLIKNSSLHLGFDSLPVHLGSIYDKKMVVLYSHYSNNTRPYFSSIKNIVLLEPDYSTVKPVFAYEDPFDLINTIDPDLIYQKTIKLLELL